MPSPAPEVKREVLRVLAAGEGVRHQAGYDAHLEEVAAYALRLLDEREGLRGEVALVADSLGEVVKDLRALRAAEVKPTTMTIQSVLLVANRARALLGDD